MDEAGGASLEGRVEALEAKVAALERFFTMLGRDGQDGATPAAGGGSRWVEFGDSDYLVPEGMTVEETDAVFRHAEASPRNAPPQPPAAG
jgi:hypothetical protein